MKKGKWVKKTVKATTNNKQKAVIFFLLSEGHSASRINTQGQWDEIKGIWRPSGSRTGFFDVVACLKSKFGVGIYLTWDQKTDDTDDELNPEQIKYMEEVKAAGGLANAGDGFKDFFPWYEEIKALYL